MVRPQHDSAAPALDEPVRELLEVGAEAVIERVEGMGAEELAGWLAD